jgi:phage regulator Rha-like protein
VNRNSISKEGLEIIIPDEVIMSKIIQIRGQKVMISNDLAELYGVTTKRLNEQVKRNIKRFPQHFMFQLNESEKDKVVANCDHLQNIKYSPYLPYVFTEHGTVMLANILNSDRAIQVSIRIVEIYIKMRKNILTNKDLLLKMEQLEKKVGHQDEKIVLVFNYLKKFIDVHDKPRKRVGFKQNDEQ